MSIIQINNVIQPTRQQMNQLKRSVKKAARGSYEKQMQVLRRYPKELKKALELARR